MCRKIKDVKMREGYEREIRTKKKKERKGSGSDRKIELSIKK